MDVTDDLGMLHQRTKDGATARWESTVRFRWHDRDETWRAVDGKDYVWRVRVLQQFWSAVPASQGEWRDVPTVTEGDAHG